MTAAIAPFVVHLAAAPVGWIQSCAACGWVLLDHAAWAGGRIAVLASDDGASPSWYRPGARVATDKPRPDVGGITYVLGPDGRALAADERLCAGAN